jgi:hypothetical protein
MKIYAVDLPSSLLILAEDEDDVRDVLSRIAPHIGKGHEVTPEEARRLDSAVWTETHVIPIQDAIEISESGAG